MVGYVKNTTSLFVAPSVSFPQLVSAAINSLYVISHTAQVGARGQKGAEGGKGKYERAEGLAKAPTF